MLRETSASCVEPTQDIFVSLLSKSEAKTKSLHRNIFVSLCWLSCLSFSPCPGTHFCLHGKDLSPTTISLQRLITPFPSLALLSFSLYLSISGTNFLRQRSLYSDDFSLAMTRRSFSSSDTSPTQPLSCETVKDDRP
ncbi:hypothetical protein AAC387_Pa08g1100 [Persea americana]